MKFDKSKVFGAHCIQSDAVILVSFFNNTKPCFSKKSRFLKKKRKTEGMIWYIDFFALLDLSIHPMKLPRDRAVILLLILVICSHRVRYSPVGSKLDRHQPDVKKCHTVWKQSQMSIIVVRSIA